MTDATGTQAAARRAGLALVAVTAVVSLAGCGSSGPRVGDCIGANHGTYGLGDTSEPRATVVQCGSGKVAAKLVSRMSPPVVHCDNIDTYDANDYNVSVDGQDFCARPK